MERVGLPKLPDAELVMRVSTPANVIDETGMITVIDHGLLHLDGRNFPYVGSGIVYFLDGRPVLASWYDNTEGRIYRGKNAWTAVKEALGQSGHMLMIYKLKKKRVEDLRKAYGSRFSIEIDEEATQPAIISSPRKEYGYIEDVLEFLRTNEITGEAYVNGDGYSAVLYVQDGEVIGAKYTDSSMTFVQYGNAALNLLESDCSGQLTVIERDHVQPPPGYEVREDFELEIEDVEVSEEDVSFLKQLKEQLGK